MPTSAPARKTVAAKRLDGAWVTAATSPRARSAVVACASVTGIRAGEFGRRNPVAAEANLEVLLDWAGAGKIAPYISHRFPLEGVEDAFRAIADRQVIGKAVLTRDT